MRYFILYCLLSSLTAVDEWHPHQHPASIIRQLNSYTEAIYTLDLSAQITASIINMPLDIGEIAGNHHVIQLDDRLARIDLSLAQARHQQAQALVQVAEAGLALAESTFRYRNAEKVRFEKLMETNSVSGEQHDAAVYAAEQARLQVRQQEAAVAQQTQQLAIAIADTARAHEWLDRHRIAVPSGWSVTRRYSEAGAIAHPNTPLLRLQDMRQLVMHFSLNESELQALRQMEKPRVFLPEHGTTVTCSVKSINPEFNPESRKREVTLRAPASAFPEASGGLSCVLQLNIPDPNNTVQIPRSFIATRFDQDRVMLQNKQWLPILIMRYDNDMAVVQAHQLPDKCILIRPDLP